MRISISRQACGKSLSFVSDNIYARYQSYRIQNPTNIKFVQFLLRPENSQIYIDRHYSFSTVDGVTQNDPSFAGLIEIMKEGRISDFPDHYYPAGFDLASILTDFARNKEKHIPDEKNITAILARCDSEYEECLKLR